ncbi:MAG: hypothetical protein RMM17_13950 [Acidobacteriota bacterium]|nr:hypothetical protein [Blastocatellia bacterium]MDW8413771.1 hypothetical protein [Acidobacteriota bacterium]
MQLPLLEKEDYRRGLGLIEVNTSIVPDASRITPPRLADGFDPKVSLSIEVELLSRASELACSQHAVRTETSEGLIRVSLAHTDERLNRDFVFSVSLWWKNKINHRDTKDTEEAQRVEHREQRKQKE